jgi:hypothetical protein
MSKVYGDIELLGGGKIINLAGEIVESDPVVDASEEGHIIYNSTDNVYKYNNGSAWLTFEVSATSNNALIETLGDVWINANFSLNPAPFNALDNISGLTTSDSLFTVIEQIDDALTNALNVVTLQGVPLAFDVTDLSARAIIYYNGANFVPGTINDLDTAEINFDEIADVSVVGLADNNIMVYQNGVWVNRKTHFDFQDLSGTVSTFVVTHNLGVQLCSVEIIDMNGGAPAIIDNALITSITFDSTSQLTVTLTGNLAVTILVRGFYTV